MCKESRGCSIMIPFCIFAPFKVNGEFSTVKSCDCLFTSRIHIAGIFLVCRKNQPCLVYSPAFSSTNCISTISYRVTDFIIISGICIKVLSLSITIIYIYTIYLCIIITECITHNLPVIKYVYNRTPILRNRLRRSIIAGVVESRQGNACSRCRNRRSAPDRSRPCHTAVEIIIPVSIAGLCVIIRCLLHPNDNRVLCGC